MRGQCSVSGAGTQEGDDEVNAQLLWYMYVFWSWSGIVRRYLRISLVDLLPCTSMTTLETVRVSKARQLESDGANERETH